MTGGGAHLERAGPGGGRVDGEGVATEARAAALGCVVHAQRTGAPAKEGTGMGGHDREGMWKASSAQLLLQWQLQSQLQSTPPFNPLVLPLLPS